jgi:acetolactate synthase small subunit
MMQQQQLQQSQEQQMQQAAIDMAKSEHGAQVQQTSNTNAEITDAQLEAIIGELMRDPQALQQFLEQMQNGQTPMGL